MKRWKRYLAALLAAVMIATPAMEVYAANGAVTVPGDEAVTVEEVTETEEAESVEEVEESGEESGEDVVETEESSEEESEEVSDEETTVVEDETIIESGEETSEEVATETLEETTEEVTTEELTTEEMTTEEATTEVETTEEMTTEVSTEEIVDEENWNGSGHKAPKLEMNLSSAMVAEKKAIEGTSYRLTRLDEDVEYVANEAVFLASSESYANNVAKGYGATLDSYEAGVAVMSFEDDVTEIIAMAEDMDVKLPAVYPNFLYTTCEDDVTLIDAVSVENSVTSISNDEFIDLQTYHDDINTAEAWSYNNTAGKGIKVAVIDSGANKNHEELKGKVATSVTYSTPWNKAEDNDGHGTHVSGIIAAKKDNKLGGAGIAYNASIMSIKSMELNPVTGDCGGSTADIIKAVNNAVKGGARVINMSLGGAYYDALFEATVDTAVDKGVVVVAAAGNDGKTMSTTTTSSTYYSPACFDNVITVSAATTGSKSIASFSNRGSGIIDIAAPGTSIASSVPGNDYAYMDGTSQAAPQVAAAAAYILSVSPDLAKSKTKATVDTVKDILQDSATKSGYTNTANFGAGLLNVEAAVKMVAPSSVNDTELKAPTVFLNGTAVVKNQVIQDTDKLTLSSTLGNVSNSEIKIYYTTNGKNPTVSDENLYTGPFSISASGNKTIKAMAVYYGKKTKVASLSVKVNSYVTDFEITSKTGVNTVASGKSLQLVAGSFVPTYATNKKVTWEITQGGEYAIIKNGKLTANKNLVSEQTVKVKATAQDRKTITAEITIKILPAVSKIELTDKADAKCKLTYPATKQMKVTVTPSGVTPPITYTSSNKKVATVSSTGLITSVGHGSATITAKTADGTNKSVKMTVTVTKPVQAVTVTSKTGVKTVAAGKSLVLLANVTSDASNKKLNWSVVSSATGKAVDGVTIKNGTLSTKNTIKSITTVRVTATAQDGSGKSGSIDIKIYPSTTKKVVLEGGTTYNIATSASGNLKTTAQLLPYTDGYTADFIGRAKGSGNTNLGNFTYKSSNVKVATVSSTGVVTAVAPGSAKITVTAQDGSNKSVSCTIKVVKPVKAVSIYSKTGVDFVGRNKFLQLGASVNSDATNKKIVWTSSNTSVATVTSSGKVKGISYGSGTATATITATAADGSGISKSFVVTVRPAITKLAFYLGENKFSTNVYTTMFVGDYKSIGKLSPEIFDETNVSLPTNPDCYWDLLDYSSSNSDILQIVPDENGKTVVVAMKKGTANLVFKAIDGSGKKINLQVKVYN